ncbi:MAG: glycosyltransferase family 4 protein [Acidimicrobiales bacterium]
MDRGHVVMGLLFFPRGGSAQVTRYLSTALERVGWSVGLVVGSLGVAGDETHAPTFFAPDKVHDLDYSDAERRFAAGTSAVAAPVPMHPSFEDRADAPDVVLAAVPFDLAGHLSAAWEAPLREAGADHARVFHLHHLTPQHDAVHRRWPATPVVAHLHGTELKFVEAVDERVALAAGVGTTLAGMPEWVAARPNPRSAPGLDDAQVRILATTRWEQWRQGEAWRDHLRVQARRADHLVVVSPTDRATATTVLGVPPDRVTDVPNGVDVGRFRPQPLSVEERRVRFRRWLVEDPRGWDESGVPGSVAYREEDLDRLGGVVLIYVGRFSAAKRVPLLLRAFARARPHFGRVTSLLVWGGHEGEWEGEHPVTVAHTVGTDGIFFAGWRGHDELPEALACSHALAMPSVNDSYPQAPLEAMAVGVPVIATLSGGFPFIVNVEPARPTGWLVPPDDETALAETLVEAVNQPAELARRGSAALAHARAHLSWDGRVAGIEQAYDLAAERRAELSPG